jgi:glycosyltransferase involved in cell wall biosynthesis
MLDPTEILFLGIGKSSVLWYRCSLPAIHLGADWCGIVGRPPALRVVTGVVRGDTKLPHYGDYKVIVLQQVHGRIWLDKIRSLQARGIKVVYEIDDYIHGLIKHKKGHEFARYYTKEHVANHELCMRACDGLICSTDYIARRYAKYNRHVYVCRNGIDLARYNLTRPERSTVNIGWAGATGHLRAVLPWVAACMPVMQSEIQTCFVSVGDPSLARMVGEAIGPTRAVGIPFTTLECYPAAMCMIDIALAPAGKTGWYRGKSDLRWLEASALEIPTIADPTVYPDIEDGVTGFHAETPVQMAEILAELVADEELRRRVGAEAHRVVAESRSSEVMALQWGEVLNAVVGEYQSIYELQRS